MENYHKRQRPKANQPNKQIKNELRRNRDTMDRGSKRQLEKDSKKTTGDLNGTTHQFELINIYGTLHQTTAEYTCEKKFRLGSWWGDPAAEG